MFGEIPLLSKEGWREAPGWLSKVRFVDIYKEATQLYQPAPALCATPPWKGGECFIVIALCT